MKDINKRENQKQWKKNNFLKIEILRWEKKLESAKNFT